MSRAEKLWHLRPSDPVATNRLAAAARVSSVVAQLLLNRDIDDPTTARRFLDTPLAALHPPLTLPGVEAASERIVKAVAEKRRICVYGDYDVDGVTGTAVLLRVLGKIGADVQPYVPWRSEGYGLSAEKLRELSQTGISLVVSVDCGIASIAEAEVAREVGLELIVTDHHEMKMGLDGPLLPPAAVLVHPRLPAPTPYPFGELSGAGVAFKLAWAVAQRASGSEKVTPELRESLFDAVGLAALGLVADVVPLRDENRILVRHGLERIRTNPSVGLKALLDASGLKPDQVLTSEDVGFKIAPRLNAAGRLGYAGLAIELLTTTSPAKAAELARVLEKENSERQARERKYTTQAKELVEEQYASDPAVVVASEEWHPGVVGIVASRLVDHFGKPALVIAVQPNESVATGSGRSIPGFALHQALVACDSLLEGHGGHAAAAGFKVRPERIASFRERFNAFVASHFPGGTPSPRLTLDAEVPLSAITHSLLADLDKLEPYGTGNPKPKFLAAGVKVEAARLIGSGEIQRHMDFRVRQGSTTIRCVAWGMADRMEELMSAGGDCCLAFTPKINEWQGYRKIELQVIDLKPGKTVELV
jgi:single-stranded-DNA-specific exonuclease